MVVAPERRQRAAHGLHLRGGQQPVDLLQVRRVSQESRKILHGLQPNHRRALWQLNQPRNQPCSPARTIRCISSTDELDQGFTAQGFSSMKLKHMTMQVSADDAITCMTIPNLLRQVCLQESCQVQAPVAHRVCITCIVGFRVQTLSTKSACTAGLAPHCRYSCRWQTLLYASCEDSQLSVMPDQDAKAFKRPK